MATILDLPLEVLSLILGHLDLRDMLGFCATCTAVRQLFRPDKFQHLMQAEDQTERDQIASECSPLMRHHALMQLFRRHGSQLLSSDYYDGLLRLGASFAPIPHGNLIKTIFLEQGPGPELAFMENCGATFDAIPGGVHALLEEVIRAERIGPAPDAPDASSEYIVMRGDYLIARGADLRKAPSSVETILDDISKNILTGTETLEFVFAHGGPIQHVPASFKSNVFTTMQYDGVSDELHSLAGYFPGLYQVLFEYWLRLDLIPDNMNLLLEAGASLRDIAVDDTTLGNQIAEGLSLKDSSVGPMAIWGASSLDDLELVKILLASGVSANATTARFGRTPLHGAAVEGSSDAAKYLVANGADLSCRDANGSTPLHMAVRAGIDIVTDLISLGADLNAKDAEDSTPLITALKAHISTVAIALLEAGADPAIPNQDGWLATHAAASSRMPGFLQLLIESDPQGLDRATVGAKGGWTPLHFAAENGDDATVDMLLSAGADVNKKNDEGYTALALAARRDMPETIASLAGHGALIDIRGPDGLTTLQWACEKDWQRIVKVLIACGANIEATTRDDLNTSPLYIAAGQNSLGSARMLLDWGAQVQNDYASTGKLSPILVAAAEGHMKMVELLVAFEASVNVANADGFTPLHLAAVNDHSRTVLRLLEFGAAVDAVDEDGTTPLHLAVAKNHLQCAKVLLQHGADPNHRTSSGHDLFIQYAAMHGYLDMLKLLARKGADLEARGLMGSTCLYLAAARGELEMIRFLVRKRVNVNSQTDDRRTPVHQAAIGGHLEVVQYLIQEGASYLTPDLNGLTPLLEACMAGHFEIIQYLIHMDPAALSNVQDGFGRTPLHWAVYGDRFEIAEWLLDLGCDVTGVDGYGRTAFDWAATTGRCGAMATSDRRYTVQADQQETLKRSVGNLSRRLLESNRRGDELGFHELGHCLMFIGDMEHAKLCYQQQITGATEAGCITHDVTCEGCSRSDNGGTDLHGSRYICMTCPDVDLCSNCHKHIAEKLPACKTHFFLQIAGLPSGYDVEDITDEIPIGIRQSLEDFTALYEVNDAE